MSELITVIDKEYVLLFCLFMVWLGMTLLVFFSNLFDSKGLGKNTGVVMYIVVTVLTILVALATINLFPPNKNNTKNKQVTNINELPVISNNEN